MMLNDCSVLILDEPTTGLDPQMRNWMWNYIRQFKKQSKSVLLTTHYMEEAERLCDRIAIINHGKLIANEPTRALVGMAQEKVVAVTVDRDIAAAPDHGSFQNVAVKGERVLEITYRKDQVNAGQVLAAVQADGFGIVDVSTKEADLEDVFLNLTADA